MTRLPRDDDRRKNRFWDEAYKVAWDSVQCWHPRLDDAENVTRKASNLSGYDIKDLPNSDSEDFSWQRLVRRKVVYLYSGGHIYRRRIPQHLLHPQADMTTEANPTEESLTSATVT